MKKTLCDENGNLLDFEIINRESSSNTIRVNDKILKKRDVVYCRCKQFGKVDKKVRFSFNIEKYAINYICKSCYNKQEESRLKNKLGVINYFQKKYGVDNPFQLEDVKSKIKDSNLSSLGVDNPSKSEFIKQKKEKTFFKHYGVSNYNKLVEVREKARERRLGKKLSKETIDKILKNRRPYKLKKYIIGNKEIYVQGYENLALDFLIKTFSLSFDDFEFEDKPVIDYIDNNNKKERRHYIDIYVKSMNRIFEVKSDYTFSLDVENILLKKQFAIKQGYDYSIIIMDSKDGYDNCIGII